MKDSLRTLVVAASTATTRLARHRYAAGNVDDVRWVPIAESPYPTTRPVRTRAICSARFAHQQLQDIRAMSDSLGLVK
ncbi:MAG: hypothetical protein U9Q35_16205 [Pseudomonadota bacterium]|mgnify:FL=1|nr:hypothetical protein [Pseudomonadota bacterium]